MSRTLILVIALLTSPHAFGCRPGPAEERPDPYSARNAANLAAKAESIYIGRVTHEASQATEYEGEYLESGRIAVLKVSRGWLSPPSESNIRVEYWTRGKCPPMDREMRVGSQYLVFQSEREVWWFALDKAGAMVESLGSLQYLFRNGFIRHMHNNGFNTDAGKAGAG